MHNLKNILKRHCEILANPKLGGRVPGTEGNRIAKLYIQERFEEVGLVPLFNRNWFQEYSTKATGKEVIGANVGGRCTAFEHNPETPNILIGAHYDHLAGIPGADDNASSIAIMIETARKIIQSNKKQFKNLNFVAFDTEERPFYLTPDMGSMKYFDSKAKENIECAIIMDLCGHDFPLPGMEDVVFLMGVDSSPTLKKLVPSIQGKGVKPLITNECYAGDKSDYYVFKNAGIPYIFISVGWWKCYHKPCDRVENLNYDKMIGIYKYLWDLIDILSNQKRIKGGHADTTKIEADHLSKLLSKEIKPERSIMDHIVSKIKSDYLDRHE